MDLGIDILLSHEKAEEFYHHHRADDYEQHFIEKRHERLLKNGLILTGSAFAVNIHKNN